MTTETIDPVALKQYVARLKPSLLGFFGYHFFPIRRKVINRNIDIAFGKHLNSAEKLKLAKSFYRHFALFAWENICSSWTSKKAFKEMVDVEGTENLVEAGSKGKGVIILTGHFGNWEIACLGGISQFSQYEGLFHFTRKTLRNKWLEKYVFSRFQKSGLNVIIVDNALEKVCEVLEKNELVVFVLDQHANLHNKEGILVDLFSEKAATNKALSLIVRHTGATVVPAAAHRKEDGRHVLSFKKPLEWIACKTSKEAREAKTRLYNQALEQMIAANPDQWLWGHKRWKRHGNDSY
jgi:Kdo2-lipid IVA lauroyltransferase/acyltransferase